MSTQNQFDLSVLGIENTGLLQALWDSLIHVLSTPEVHPEPHEVAAY